VQHGTATWAELPSISLRYSLSGTGPRSLVLLHELGGSLDSFDGVLPLLEHRFRILRYDQRGAGQSEKPRARFTMEDHAADLAGLLAATGLLPPILLAGIAAGCAIAVMHALAAPAVTAGLLLCAPALHVAPDRQAYLQERSDRAVAAGMRAVEEASLSRSYPPALRGDAAVFARCRAGFLANDPVCYAHANLALAGSRLGPHLAGLAVPCQVLAGRHDLLRPPDEVQATAASIPGAGFAVVDSGHLMAVQAPAAVAAAILTLAERTAPAGVGETMA